MKQLRAIVLAAVVGGWALSAVHVSAGRIVVAPAAGAPGAINLPYTVPDGHGNQWMIYNAGWFQQQGNTPLYSQAAMLTINGAQPNMRGNQAKLDESGEVIFENLPVANLLVTRRILINKEQGSIRYVDVIKNPRGQDVVVNLQIQTNLNYGVQASQMIADPKRKEHNLAWVAQTGAGRSVVEVFGGKGAKIVPTLNWPQGNNYVQAIMQLSVPANKEVALLHVHTTANSQEAGAQFVSSIKESKLLAQLPKELRKIVINFEGGQNFIGDHEILRGELFDVVELRGGDQVRGSLKEKSYKLETFYGVVELPVDRVIGMINVGQFRPRQLLVTMDGEIFGGKLMKETVDLQLTSGQLTQVPLGQISRLGYRRRPGEPEEWTFDRPFVMLRSGDRVGVQMPTGPIDVLTRYGPLQLDPRVVAAIAFQAEEHGAHEIRLTDGSRFTGLVNAQQFPMTLGAGAQQQVTFPASGISRLQLSSTIPEPDENTPTLSLLNDDLLVGTLTGQLKLDTAFDTITIDAAQIKRLSHAQEAGLDVQVTLWDQTTVSGQLQQPELECHLSSGAIIRVPVSMLSDYSQPQPQPSALMVERIKAVVAELNADDFNQRDRAQQQLTAMGPTVAVVLRKLRSQQPPEAQQRIDQILAALNETKPGVAPALPVEE